MTILLYAQPYDISAEGFYFRSIEEYDQKARDRRNSYGEIVEEYEIQFIDGGILDCELAKAIGLNQCNQAQYLEGIDTWDDDEKQVLILALGECGYDFTDSTVPCDFDLDIYHVESLRELAQEFLDEGLFGEIPENFRFYLDMDAIARDLGMDYSEAIVGGERLVYRCE